MRALEATQPEPSKVLMKAFNKASNDLGLTAVDKSVILGVNRTTLKRNELQGFSPDSKTGEIQLHFIRIYRSLFAIAGGDLKFMKHWYCTNNKALNGSPSELCQKLNGLFLVNQYLDAMRGKI